MHLRPDFQVGQARPPLTFQVSASPAAPVAMGESFQHSLPLEAVGAAPRGTQGSLIPLMSEMTQKYLQASDVQQVLEKGSKLGEMAKTMVACDVAQVLGANEREMKANFMLAPEVSVDGLPAFSQVILGELSKKVLAHVKDGQFHDLDCQRLSLDRQQDAVAQHVGYVAGQASRLGGLSVRPNQELCRILLRKHFQGELKSTLNTEQPPLQLLAGELAKTTPQGEVLSKWVLAPENASMFGVDSVKQPPSLLANLAAYHAGECTLEFASRLFEGDEQRAAAFVKRTFGRPEADLQQLLRDPQGKEGLLVHFAATASHLAWQWSKLGSGYVAAKNGDEKGALKAWNHPNLGATRALLAQDQEAARKVGDQIESYLLREGKLVPIQRESQTGQLPLGRLLEEVEQRGIYSDPSGQLRVISPFAVQVGEQLHNEVQMAATLSDWKAGAELAADIVSNTCASFATQAVGTDFEGKDRLVSLFRGAIGRFTPQLDRLLSNGVPSKQDQAYQALYQDLAGEFSFEALKDHLGQGRAKELVREAKIGHLVPIVCKLLRLPQGADFTPQQVVADIAEMKKNLLKDDYFLQKGDLLESMRSEAEQPHGEVKSDDLESGVRVPNAVWMWTQLLRGLVEGKPQRYTGRPADFKSDAFPSQLQLNPPDTRDVELFSWARHRLREADYDSSEATRMAMSLVLFTQYKDLLQLRKVA
jgi:hypothetical protein